jgi:lipoate-protein ligase A
MDCPAPSVPPYTEDEALLEDARRAAAARTRVYRLPRPVVVLGAGSRADAELHLDACLADGVPLLRRRGGGCAVVIDPGNVVVALAYPAAGIGGSRAHFERITAWLANALAAAGVPRPELRGASDLAVGDRKVGGACIWRSRDLLYYSTTLLVAPDPDLMDRYLRHPPREPDYRAGRPHREFVVGLAELAPGCTPALLEGRLAVLLDASVLPSPAP